MDVNDTLGFRYVIRKDASKDEREYYNRRAMISMGEKLVDMALSLKGKSYITFGVESETLPYGDSAYRPDDLYETVTYRAVVKSVDRLYQVAVDYDVTTLSTSRVARDAVSELKYRVKSRLKRLFRHG